MTTQNETDDALTEPTDNVEGDVVAAEPGTTANGSRPKRRRVVVLASLMSVAAISVLAWWFWTAQRSGAGKPVPAPTSMGSDQPMVSTLASTGSMIKLSPEVASRAGIKVEEVAEQLAIAGDASGGTVATGVVQANSYRSTPVVSLVGGILRQVNAELGQNLRRGQTVATVFSDDLAMTQSRYLAALAALEEHHQHHKRITALVEIGAASREELEQTTTMLVAAESAVAAQRERLLLLGLSSELVRNLRSSSQVSSLVSLPAPVSGSVITRSANPGEVIEANKEILRIADLSSVWVIGQVYEKDLGRIRVGSGAQISSESYPGRLFRGQVTYVDPNLDQATRTAQVRIELANPGQVLKLGMYVNIGFASLGAANSTVPSIPAGAVQQVNNQQVVFVATNEGGAYTMRPVRLGPEVNGRYQVLEGLKVGDRIVTEGSFLLRAELLKLNVGASSPATDHEH